MDRQVRPREELAPHKLGSHQVQTSLRIRILEAKIKFQSHYLASMSALSLAQARGPWPELVTYIQKVCLAKR